MSEYDLVTADAMLKSKRYLYVAFTCQQAIEKMLKACYVAQFNKTPPYTHSLIRIAETLSFYKDIDEKTQKEIELVNSYYIVSRYCENYHEMSRGLTPEHAEQLYNFTKEFVEWLKSQMK